MTQRSFRILASRIVTCSPKLSPTPCGSAQEAFSQFFVTRSRQHLHGNLLITSISIIDDPTPGIPPRHPAQKISKYNKIFFCIFPSFGPVYTSFLFSETSPTSHPTQVCYFHHGKNLAGLRHISQGRAVTPFRHVRAPILGQTFPSQAVRCR